MDLADIYWVILPHGYQDARRNLSASIIVTPKPRGDGTTKVAAFAELVDWPQTLRGTTVGVTFSDSGGLAPPVTVPIDLPSADSDFWKVVFPEDLRVNAVPLAAEPNVTYDALAGYNAVTAYLDELISYEEQVAQGGVSVAPPLPDTSAVDAYFESLAPGRDQGERDFHDTLHGAAQILPIARRLGLLFDVSIPTPTSAYGTYDSARISAILHSSRPFPVSLPVKFDRDFYPASDTYIANGLLVLKLSNHRVVLDQIDPLAEIRNLSKSEQSGERANTVQGSSIIMLYGNSAARVTAVRAKGLKMLRALRAKASPNDVLTAHDLVVGYAVDVQDLGPKARPKANPTWQSLCRVDTLIRYADGTVNEFASEGHIPPLRASVLNGGKTAASDVLVRWTNENLCAARSMGEDKNYPAVPQRQAFAADTFAADATLPPLRYGHRYRFRFRAVDASGWSRGVDGATTTSDVVTYRRFAPIQPPILIEGRDGERTAPTGLGDGTYTVVIRTANDGDDPTAYKSEVNVRYILPPKISMRFSEMHGVLDTGGQPDPAKLAHAFGLDNAAFPKSMGRHDGAPQYLADPLCRRIRISVVPNIGTCSPAVGEIRVRDKGDASATYWDGDRIAIRPLKLLVRSLPSRSLGPPTGEAGVTAELHASEVDRTVSVALQPGVTATLSLTSLFDFDPANAEAYDTPYLALANRNPAARRAAQQGQLPSVTPPRPTLVIHAIKRPWFAPVIVSASCARSPLGKTSVVTVTAVLPNASAIGYRLDEASFEWGKGPSGEPMRSIRKGTAGTWNAASRNPRVQGLSPRGAVVPLTPQLSERWLGVDDVMSPDETKAAHSTSVWSQELDTAYHDFTYTLVAHSRFASYFRHEDPSSFERGSVQFKATPPTLNTRPPDPITSIDLVSTLRWTIPARAVGRTRVGWTIRMLLDGSWYLTGDGEALGVILPGASTPAAFIPEYVSWLGADPIWPRNPASALTAYRFDGADGPLEPLRNVTMRQVDPVTNAILTGPVDVVPMTTRFDPVRGRWYVDLRLTALTMSDAAKYMPFVRFVVGRFQPNSLSDLALSQVTVLDAIQLLPSRTLTLHRTSNVKVTATLYWPDRAVPHARDVLVEVRLDPRDPHCDALSPTPIALDFVPFDASGTARYEIEHAHLDAYSLSISEFELYRADRAEEMYRRRLVYYDAFELRHVRHS